jgi:hypothetical protein
VTPEELLDALATLAGELDLEVRRGASGDSATSGVCRLRGRVWVVLSAADPPARRIAVLAAALREHAGPACDARYLPPAVRAALEGAPDTRS